MKTKKNFKKIIINVDDFGLHEKINSAVIKAHQLNCLKSTSIMATGKAFDEAAELARENPNLGVGVHLTLVAENSVLDAKKIPSLIDQETGKFFESHVPFVKKFLSGQINLQDVYNELNAQILKVKAKKISITHLDSHQHLHVLPILSEVVCALAKEHQIAAIRYPCESPAFFSATPISFARYIARDVLSCCAYHAKRNFQQNHLIFPENFFGMASGGQLYLKNYLKILQTIEKKNYATNEIMTHIGEDNAILDKEFSWGYHWQEEFHALISDDVRNFFAEHKMIQLASYRDIISRS